MRSAIFAVPSDSLDWSDLAEGHRYAAAPAWLKLAGERLPDAQAFCLRDENDEVRVAMWGRVVPGPTGHPWADPYQLAADRLGSEQAHFPSLALMYPNFEAFPVGPGASDPLALQRFVGGLQGWAREAGARTVVFQYLGPEAAALAEVTAGRGFNTFPVAHRAELPVAWDDLAGYLATFGKRRRDKIKHEIRSMTDAGIRFETRQLRSDETELVRLRRAYVVKYGGRDDPDREERWFHRIGECFDADDVFVVVAHKGGAAIAFTLFVRDREVLTALMTGADYGHPWLRYVYFGTSFYTPVQFAAGLGVRTIEYGMGSEQAKRSRGCVLMPLHWAVGRTDDPPAQVGSARTVRRPDVAAAGRPVRPSGAPPPRSWAERLPAVGAPRILSRGPGEMSTNEAVLPPSEAAVAAMRDAAGEAHHYPDGAATRLRAAIGAEHGVDPDTVMVGNGSEELLHLLLGAYAAGGGRVAMADPACAVHERLCRLVDAEPVRRPLSAWTHDLGLLSECAAEVVLICNPHNPTGTAVSRADIAALLDRRDAGLVIVDEAYVDFVDEPSRTTCVSLVEGRTDTVVVRTFSKLHGLAGSRVGYLIAPPEVIATVRKLQMSFPVNAIAQAGAVAALGDTAHRHRVWRSTHDLRARLADVLTLAGYTVVPSQANFVFAEVPDEESFVERLAGYGITVRAGRSMGVPGSVRVTVPPEDGIRLMETALGVQV